MGAGKETVARPNRLSEKRESVVKRPKKTFFAHSLHRLAEMQPFVYVVLYVHMCDVEYMLL